MGSLRKTERPPPFPLPVPWADQCSASSCAGASRSRPLALSPSRPLALSPSRPRSLARFHLCPSRWSPTFCSLSCRIAALYRPPLAAWLRAVSRVAGASSRLPRFPATPGRQGLRAGRLPRDTTASAALTCPVPLPERAMHACTVQISGQRRLEPLEARTSPPFCRPPCSPRPELRPGGTNLSPRHPQVLR